MGRFLISTALFLCTLSAVAAQVGTPRTGTLPDHGKAPHRTEFISYDIRAEADADLVAGAKYVRVLDFKAAHGDAENPSVQSRDVDGGGVVRIYETSVDIPALWLDRDIYIRDTGRTGHYRLLVNGREVGVNADSYGGGEFHVTPFLKEGANTISLAFGGEVPGSELESSYSTAPVSTTIKGLYIFSQPRIHIFDYTAAGRYDAGFKDTAIDMAVVVVNGYNMPETVRVGYDVWTPDGKLKDYLYETVTIPGLGCDTVRLRGKVTGTERHRYSAGNAALYRVTLQLRHGGRDIEYIPMRLGFGVTSYDGTRVSRDGVPIEVRAVEGDFPQRDGALAKLRALKKEGYNTIAVVRPQQKWFYDMTAAEGIYVIDRAAVECDPRGGDRTPAGTVANDPSYLARFIDRQAAMFHRRRNYPNVIGWSIGSASGNGYNMYKSYRFLKALDAGRPVIYVGAEGAWTSDPIQN